jgi:hypothetical protein
VNAAEALGFSKEESSGYNQRPKLLLWLLIPGVGVLLFMRLGLKARKENLEKLHRSKRRMLRGTMGKRLSESENNDTHTQRPPSDDGAGGRY